jgi:hypothetical protein
VSNLLCIRLAILPILSDTKKADHKIPHTGTLEENLAGETLFSTSVQEIQ